MSEPPDPKSWLLDRARYIRTLLMEVTTSKTWPLSQENVHAEYFRRLDLLELEESIEQLDTKPMYRNDAMEFKHLRNSILNLEREAFMVYTNLRIQEAHNTRPSTQPHPLELRQ